MDDDTDPFFDQGRVRLQSNGSCCYRLNDPVPPSRNPKGQNLVDPDAAPKEFGQD
jgi:hypothetical protein